MSIDILTATGEHVNPEQETYFLQPVCQCNSIVIDKKAETVKNWEDIFPRLKITKEKQGKVARIDNSDRNMQDIIVKDGYGIYVDKNNGVVKHNFIYDDYNKNVSRIHISRYKDGRYICSRYFTTLIGCLYPSHMRRYIQDKGLDVNHCIIDMRGSQRIEFNSEFYEIVDKGRNKAHSTFIKRYNLYGAPVSCFDFDRLIDLYNVNGVGEVNLNEEFVAGEPLEVVLKDLDTYRAAYRRLITWVYYIKHHTNGNDRVWRAFYDYFEQEFATSIDGLGKFKEYIAEML